MNGKDSNKGKSRNTRAGSKRSGGSRGYKQGSHIAREPKDDSYRREYQRASNSPEWYASNPQLMIDSASIPYSYATGSKLPLSYDQADIYSTQYKIGAVPGIMTIGVLPTVGISNDNSSPVNIAARKIYAWVRHANSGSRIYDAPDLMLYLLAMDNIYTMYSHCMRALGFARLYSQKNRYLADTLISAMGFAASDLQKNLADYRFRLNTIGAKISSMAVPNTMSYFVRHAWMFQNVYKDGESDKSQLYLYKPAGYYTYNPTAETTGGSLRYTAIDQDVSVLFSTRLTYLDQMVAAVIQDEDMNVMSGDIIKAYGTDKLIKIGMIPEDILLAPVYDKEVLSQIQNVQFVGLEDSSSCHITQDENAAILFNPAFTVTGNVLLGEGEVLFNIDHDGVTPAETMVASRLTNIQHIDGSTVTLDYCGSEIATCGYVWYFDDASAWNGRPFRRLFNQFVYDITDVATNPTATIDAIKAGCLLLGMISQFNYHPQVKLGVKTSTTTWYYYNTMMQLENYTILTEEELARMHQTALLSEFDVQGVGRA